MKYKRLDGYTPYAFLETVSGFTTTGASILLEVGKPFKKYFLFWRSFTHWIGGMGVLVFLLAILPMTGGSNINLMKAEMVLRIQVLVVTAHLFSGL